jgi:hypothetical protein
MKRTIGIILFILSLNVFSQTERVTEFYPLTPIDTISNFKVVNISESIDSLNSTDYFFTYKDHEYKSGLLLTKKHNDKWVIYELNLELFSSSNTTIGNFRLVDKKYIFIQIYRSPSGRCSNIYGFLTILNIESCKTIDFCNYNYEQCYDENAEVSSQSVCETTSKFENGILTLKCTDSSDGLNCIESAEYKIRNDSLIKTKYYLTSHKNYYPIVCNEEYNICTGTNFNILKNKFSNIIFKDLPVLEYGYDPETIGKGFYINNELQFFVLVNSNDIITAITFISPRYKFNQISTETKISEIINKYPKSKLKIDLISDWEYIFIKELNVCFIFKTNDSNRIGVYTPDIEEGTRDIKRQNVTVDFIQI